jgi:hypothetical protein
MNLREITRHPSALLLLVQLLGVLLYPLMEDTPGGQAAFGAFGIVVLGLALWVIRRSPWLSWIGFLLALPIFALLVLNALAPQPVFTPITAALEAAFYFYATGSLISYMLQDDVASTDELFAVGATFTLLAWGFAHLYTVCQALVPGSFVGAVDPAGDRSWMELLFLSFTTLSGVGLGDILPLKPMARALVMLEQLAGVLFIALVVSRLIGMTFGARRHKEHPDD